MAIDLARLIGGPGDGITFRIDAWPPPNLLIFGGSPDAESVEPNPAIYTLRSASSVPDTFAGGGDALVRSADYDHGGEWVPLSP
jgi:hypothetical protein